MHSAKNQQELSEINSRFIDALIAHEHVKNDAELANLLDMTPPGISKRRRGILEIGGWMMVKIMRQNPTWNLAKVESLFKESK